MSLATVAAVVGIGSAAYGAYNTYENSRHQGGAGGALSGGPNQYIPGGLGDADQSWQDLLKLMTGGAEGAGGAINPALLQSFQQLMGIDRSGLTGAGAAAGRAYGDVASDYSMIQQIMSQQGLKDFGAQDRLMGAGDELWKTALDPENKLATRLQQQVTDASRAGTSARGIGMSGNAAGIENQAVDDFLMNWQDRQLGRQATGLQGMTGAYGEAGRQGQAGNAALTGGANIAGMIPQLLMQSGLAPYNMNVQAAGAPMDFANMFSGAQGNSNNMMSQIMQLVIPYLNSGQGAVNSQFGQNQTNLNNLTTGLQQFGQNGPQTWQRIMQMFGGGGSPYGGGGGGGSSDYYGGEGFSGYAGP